MIKRAISVYAKDNNRQQVLWNNPVGGVRWAFMDQDSPSARRVRNVIFDLSHSPGWRLTPSLAGVGYHLDEQGSNRFRRGE